VGRSSRENENRGRGGGSAASARRPASTTAVSYGDVGRAAVGAASSRGRARRELLLPWRSPPRAESKTSSGPSRATAAHWRACSRAEPSGHWM
jgi:hypothetical protein